MQMYERVEQSDSINRQNQTGNCNTPPIRMEFVSAHCGDMKFGTKMSERDASTAHQLMVQFQLFYTVPTYLCISFRAATNTALLQNDKSVVTTAGSL